MYWLLYIIFNILLMQGDFYEAWRRGPSQCGKNALFNALIKQSLAANYPFLHHRAQCGHSCQRETHLRKCSTKKLYTAIEFVDIAGLVKGASKGEGLK